MVGSLNDWRLQGYLFQDGTGLFFWAMKAFFFSIFQGGRGGMAWFLSFTYHDLFSRAYLFFRHFHGVVQ